MNNPRNRDIVMKMTTTLTVITITKLLGTQRVTKALEEVDARTFVAQRSATRAIGRRVQNARENVVWLAAGSVAIALGIGLVVKATRKG